MSPASIPGQPQELDLRAVQRDARWLDDLAARAPVPADRRALALLQALAVEVDTGLGDLLDQPLSTTAPKDSLRPTDGRRRLGARAIAAGLVATGLLSVGGV